MIMFHTISEVIFTYHVWSCCVDLLKVARVPEKWAADGILVGDLDRNRGIWVYWSHSRRITRDGGAASSQLYVPGLVLVIWNWPCWVYLHHGNLQMLQVRVFLENWLLNLNQHTTAVNPIYSCCAIDSITQKGNAHKARDLLTSPRGSLQPLYCLFRYCISLPLKIRNLNSEDLNLMASWSAWLAQLGKHVTPDLEVIRSSPMLGAEITINK